MFTRVRTGVGRAAGHQEVVLWLGVFAFALIIALAAIQPFRVFAIGYDAASTVVYFDRMAAGQRLEAFLGTTPKPLLSVVYGLAFGIFGDWRAVGCIAAGAYASGIASAAVLVARVSGSFGGAAFVATGLIASWQLFQDVSLAYAVSWMLLACAVAGLAVTGATRHYGLAGCALLLGALARQETLFITGFAVVGVLIGFARARSSLAAFEPRRAWLVAIGFLAIRITALGDWLLTGDLGYSLKLQALGAVGHVLPELGGTETLVSRHLQGYPALLILALIGLGLAIRRRQWSAVIGLIALGPGVTVFVLFVGWRELIVLERYLLPVDIAMVFGAGIAVGIMSRYVHAALRSWPTLTRMVLPVAAIGLALGMNSRIGPLDGALRQRLDLESGGTADLAMLAPALEREIAGFSGVRDRPVAPNPFARCLDRIVILVPARYLPAILAEFRIPLDRVTYLEASRLATDGSYPRPGWIVYQQAGLSVPESAYSFLEVDGAAVAGRLAIDPVATVDHRAWLLRVTTAP